MITCQLCGSTEFVAVLELSGIPVDNSRLFRSSEEARAVAVGDLELMRCIRCGFIQNVAFEESLVTYDIDYEADQFGSPFFRAFADRVIGELLSRYQLDGCRTLEIGCGGGEFLERVCELSGGSGVGFDPVVASGAGTRGQVELRAERFIRGSGHNDADLVICRHTLEHVPDVASFLSVIRGEFEDRMESVLYLEIPNTEWIDEEGAFWGLHYEHCSYLDDITLASLLRRSGFEVLECRVEYDGQYVVAHARPSEGVAELDDARPWGDFRRVKAAIADWQDWASAHQRRGSRVALWGATSKAVSFMSFVDTLRPVVAVDINPRKAGGFLPATATPICGPAELASYDADTVLAMNPVYLSEIQAELDRLGNGAELLAVEYPSVAPTTR